jgi:hypothetical protein
MSNETPMINILTYQLPYKLTNQIYNEYQSRLKEAIYLIENYETYKPLSENINTVELFLSLSIFHKRVITNLDGAVKFYGTVTKKGQTDTIQIGGYKMTGEEKNKILAVLMNYNQLLEKFSITPVVMEYFETREFLKKLIVYKSDIENGNNQKPKGKEDNKDNQEDDFDLPF